MLLHMHLSLHDGNLDEMLLPYPAHLSGIVVLVDGEPELSLFADDVEDLDKSEYSLNEIRWAQFSLPHQRHMSGKDNLPPDERDRY